QTTPDSEEATAVSPSPTRPTTAVGQRRDLVTATPSPSPSPAPRTQVVPTDTPLPKPTVRAASPSPGYNTIFGAQFASRSSAWPDNPASTAWLADGSYHLFVRDPARFVGIAVPIA